jgi:hypothetical protein
MQVSLLVSRSTWNSNYGILSEISNANKGKKTSRQKDVLSYFQKPPFKHPHSLHTSISFEQPITEIDVTSSQNASNIHIIDERIGSCSDQCEINAFSP